MEHTGKRSTWMAFGEWAIQDIYAPRAVFQALFECQDLDIHIWLLYPPVMLCAYGISSDVQILWMSLQSKQTDWD